MKLLVTRELGRLARWLRILGLDTAYVRDEKAATVIIQALREDRTVLTRNHRLPAGRGIPIVSLTEEKIRDQIVAVVKRLGLVIEPQSLFSRCSLCNAGLVPAEKPSLEGKVPAYVFKTQERFWNCPQCGRIYWHGTHWGNVERLLKELI